ncbi:MAG: TIGR02391 family protein [Acidobacteriales bacterium]|nr:TIGR02391 family protein [Terriglobales bacterium]
MGRRPQPQSIPPTMQPHQAIPLLRRQLERLEETLKLSRNEPAVDGWVSTTTNILDAVYGKPNGELHPNTHAFRFAHGGPIHLNMPESEIQAQYVQKQQKRKALLEAYIEQLRDLAPPAAATASEQYRFHAEIERVSGQLYRDGHYKQAALEAYICVIDEVRNRSGLDMDGDNLMNHALACDNRTPVIQFNSLQTAAEMDEQRGFWCLFKGIVGLRNSKAHSNRLFDDPYRAHDYLALCSVLMRVLEIATIHRKPEGER